MSQLARDIGMTREGLYKALSESDNPTFSTVMKITRALGMQVRIGCLRCHTPSPHSASLAQRSLGGETAQDVVGDA